MAGRWRGRRQIGLRGRGPTGGLVDPTGEKEQNKKEKWPVEAARVLFVGWPAVDLHVKCESQLTGRALPSKY